MAKQVDNRMQLVETKAPISCTPVLTEETGTGRLRVEGIFQRVGVENGNKRIYPQGVWDKSLATDSSFVERVGARSVLGELEHPESGSTHLGRVSHLIEKVWQETLEESNKYNVEAGNYVLGRALILNTPSGRILRELYEVQVPVGVSSRGRGDVVTDANGVDVVQDNYEPDAFDFVYDPSVVEARPQPIADEPVENPAVPVTPLVIPTEGTELKGSDLTEMCRATVKLVDQACSEDTPLPNLVERLADVSTLSTQLGAGSYNDVNATAAKSLLEGCKKHLVMAINQKEQPVTETRAASSVRRSPTVVNSRRSYEAVLAEMAARTVKAEAAATVSPRGRSLPRLQDGQLKRRYDAVVSLADGLLTKGRKLTTENKTLVKEQTTLNERYAAAVALTNEMVQRLRVTEVAQFVTDAITEAPRLANSRALLMEAKTIDEARGKLKLIATALAAGQSDGTTPLEESTHIYVPRGGGASAKPVKSGPMSLIGALHERKGL